MTKILFVCNQNKNRSKTAELLFQKQFQTKSAGLYSQKPVNRRQLSWADVVMVMEDTQRQEIAKRFPAEYLQKRILSLDIPDVYDYGDPQLIQQLKQKMSNYSTLLACMRRGLAPTECRIGQDEVLTVAPPTRC